MAVQKSKKSRSRRGMRRSHDSLGSPAVSEDATTGEMHLRHHIGADGYYRGRKVLNVTEAYEPEDDIEE